MNKDELQVLEKAYARIIVKTGVNLRSGQCLLINTGFGTYEFARRIAEIAYQEGAKYVRINVTDNHLNKYRIEHAQEEDLDWLPNFVLNESYEYLAQDWARIRIDNTEELDVLKDADADKMARIMTAQRKALRRQQEALMKDHHSWCVVAAPGPNWARYVIAHSGLGAQFGKLDESALTEWLWKQLKPILRLDKPDPVNAWEDHMSQLAGRCDVLNQHHFDRLHFVAKDTDLEIGLLSQSVWRGGRGLLPDARPFLANLPTEEVYTTPDYRRTTGHVKVCRPVTVMETLVEGAWFEFKEGKAVKCGADKGEEVLKKFLAIDQGASFLGEIALVAGESPIFKSGLIFGSILYDENASCHMAFGAGYPSCLANVASLNSQEEIKAAGCNTSLVHTDFMIGTPQTDVFGIKKDASGNEVRIPIIVQGAFKEV